MNLRNVILIGLALATATIVFTFGTILLNFPKILVLLGACWCGMAMSPSAGFRRERQRTLSFSNAGCSGALR